MTGDTKPRILFVGEAGTLSHVVRPLVLAKALDQEKYQIFFASDPRFNDLFASLPFTHIPINCRFDPNKVVELLSSAMPLFDTGILDDYVKEDLILMSDVAPDIVVGDMRQSLAISSRVAGVTYINIINAQWSPFARLDLELPQYPLAEIVGDPLAEVFFKLFFPVGSAAHSLPFNIVGLKYGVPDLRSDIKQVYTSGDYVVYPDLPELVPTWDLPSNHRYIGPVLWSPKIELPEWWDELPPDKPIVYVGMGTSGQHGLIDVIVAALADLPVSVLIATASRSNITSAPANLYQAKYLPGLEVAKRASLVVCTGGSMPAQQSLAGGAPILAIPSNADQLVYARAVSRAGAGEVIVESKADVESIRSLARSLLTKESYRESARNIAQMFESRKAPEHFNRLIDDIFSNQMH